MLQLKGNIQNINNIKKTLETLATKKVSIVLALNFSAWM